MSPEDLATLFLIDPDQGVCPEGHRCRADDQVGFRRCVECGYRGLALICWEVTIDEVNAAEQAGAKPDVIVWARQFLANRPDA